MIRIMTLVCCLFMAPYSFAGTSCDPKPMTPALIATATDKALALRAYLNKVNPTVAIVARVGADLSKYGLHYTHAAFVIRRPGDNEWSVLHLLNTCGTTTSRIYEQGLANFFLDDLFSMDTEVIVPIPKLQKKLALVLASNKVTSFHDKNYSKIAYPFSTEYQQSNQWVLELLVSAMFAAEDRETAQKYLEATDFKPTYIPISALSKFGANITEASVSFNDHPDSEATSGKYSVVTVDAIVNYMKAQQLLSSEKEL
jgi:hypothetical protein